MIELYIIDKTSGDSVLLQWAACLRPQVDSVYLRMPEERKHRHLPHVKKGCNPPPLPCQPCCHHRYQYLHPHNLYVLLPEQFAVQHLQSGQNRQN